MGRCEKQRLFPFGGGPAPLVNIDVGGLQGARAGSPASLMGVFFARTGVDFLPFFVTRPSASHSALQDSPCRKPRAQRIAYDPCPHGCGRSSARTAGTSRRIDLLILLLCAKDIARRCSCQRAASGWAGRFEHANTSRPRGNTRTIHARREGREYLAAVIRVIGFVLRTGHRMAG